jgi:hypothetical protein
MNKNILDWIIKKLNGIDYQITGGLAAFWYGSKREIYDIDLEVSDSDVYRLSEICREHIIYGPERYVDEHFDLLLMTLDYGGQLIDVCGIDSMYIRGWLQLIDFNTSVEINGMKVVLLADLIAYKKLLNREVDLIDIELLNKKSRI